MATTPFRKHGYIEFNDDSESNGGWTVRRARAKTFTVEWCKANGLTSPLDRSQTDEAITVFPATAGTIAIDGIETIIPARTIAIIPAGKFSISLGGAGDIILLAPIRQGVSPADVINAADYSDGDDEGMQEVAGSDGQRRALQLIPIDDIVPPVDKPRLKIVRSETMSVSWIEYEGLRDRTKLSPHDHDDFEQGSLAIEGRFIHHMRTPWTADATQWRDDVHLAAAPGSLCVIPPRIVHTTEGEGAGRHVLLDIFAPARADFAANGWVFNQKAYVPSSAADGEKA